MTHHTDRSTPRLQAHILSTICSPDHRSRPRRRGEVLRAAIFHATLEELREVGYRGLTIEHVAARARASKGSLYRRWSRRADLVADAIEHTLPRRSPLDTGDVRTDLLDYLRQLTSALNGPTSQALHGLMADTVRDPELMQTIRARFIDPTINEIINILNRGAARGEVRPHAVTTRIAGIAPALLREHFLERHTIPDPVLTEIVDDVLMPLIRI